MIKVVVVTIINIGGILVIEYSASHGQSELQLSSCATLLIPVIVMRAKSLQSSKPPLLDFKVFREVPRVLFSIAEFFGFMGMYIPFYYIATLALKEGIVNNNLSIYLHTLRNLASVFGHIVPNFYGDFIGTMNMMLSFGLLCGVKEFC